MVKGEYEDRVVGKTKKVVQEARGRVKRFVRKVTGKLP